MCIGSQVCFPELSWAVFFCVAIYFAKIRRYWLVLVTFVLCKYERYFFSLIYRASASLDFSVTAVYDLKRDTMKMHQPMT